MAGQPRNFVTTKLTRIRLLRLLHLVMVLGLANFILAGSGCNAQRTVNLLKYSDSLVLVEGAQNPTYSKYLGTDQLIYTVDVQYPAAQVIKEIYEKLGAKGWEPLSEDYLNPGLPSSHVRGWTDFIDSTEKPHRKVHQWLTQWEDSNQDIVWCTLRYSYPERAQPDLKSLKVSIIFIPSKLAIESRKQMMGIPPQDKGKF